MPAVTLDPDVPGQCVEIDGALHLYTNGPAGEFMMPATCPHRGGPLHLATVTADGCRVVCPWHENAFPVSRLQRTAIPAVRNGETVHVVAAGPGPSLGRCVPVSSDLERSRFNRTNPSEQPQTRE